jgi:signal transduction histidine kinase
VEQKDEVGQLAETFNHMSLSLKEAVQLRQRFLADAAHELRTPLAVIQGNLEGMLDGIVPADEKNLSSLREETLHLNRLIQDLRELSLVETGQLPLEKEEVELSVLAARAASMLQPLAEENQVLLQAEVEEAPFLRLDKQRMNQIIYNLLTNALRHTPPGGRVMVSVRREEKEVVLVVSDTGEGMASEHLPYIFEHFYRVDASRDRRSGGSGIGLAIVRRLVEAQGGKVTVQSQLGEGSCFEVRFKKS